MRYSYYSTFIFVFFIFLINITKGQSAATIVEPSYLGAKIYFKNEIKEDSHLYTGKEYYKYESGIKGFPFFMSDQMQNGDIFYDGNLYKDVPLLFDIVRQAVVINQYNKTTRMQLLIEKIKYFTLNGHHFETTSQALGREDNISKELYDVLYSGNAGVLVKRVKKIITGFHAEDPYLFKEEDEFYIRKGRSLYGVSDGNGVMEALEDKKDLIKTFIRKNKLSFKKNIEKDLIITADYYSTLN